MDGTLTLLYTVTIDNTITGGTVTPDNVKAAAGETVTLTVTPDEGYRLSSLTYTCGETVTNIQPVQGVYSFAMPAGNVTVTATYSAITTKYTITYVMNDDNTDPATFTGLGYNVTASFDLPYVDEPEGPETHYIILTTKGRNPADTVTMGEKVIVLPKYATDQDWQVTRMTSSNRKVADINETTGELEMFRTGKTTIRVKAKAPKKKRGWKTVSASIRLTVVDPTIPTSISIDQGKEITVYVGKEDIYQLTVTAEPKETASKEVTWKSSKKTVVDVDANGKLTPKRKGKATITATSTKNKKKNAKITVYVTDLTVPTGIKLSTETGSTTLITGGSLKLKYDLTGPDETVPAVSEVKWKSKSTKIARVSSDGLVTALKPGTVEIVATTKIGKVSGSITLTVVNTTGNEADIVEGTVEDEMPEETMPTDAVSDNVEAAVESITANLTEE